MTMRRASSADVRSGFQFSAVVLAVVVVGLQAFAMFTAGRADALPKGSAVRLGSGQLIGFRWTADTYRPKSRHGASRPCLHIGFEPADHSAPQDPLEISVESTNCGPLHPTPDLVSLVDEVDEPKMTALVMAFPLKVHSVRLYFNGPVADRTVQLHLLSSQKATKAHLDPFRYGTFAFTGDSCISRFVARSRTGRMVYDGGRMNCRVRS